MWWGLHLKTVKLKPPKLDNLAKKSGAGIRPRSSDFYAGFFSHRTFVYYLCIYFYSLIFFFFLKRTVLCFVSPYYHMTWTESHAFQDVIGV